MIYIFDIFKKLFDFSFYSCGIELAFHMLYIPFNTFQDNVFIQLFLINFLNLNLIIFYINRFIFSVISALLENDLIGQMISD